MDKEDKYRNSLVLPGDNTLKQFFDRFYVIPKDCKFDNDSILKKYRIPKYIIKQFLEENTFSLSDPRVKAGKDGYIVERKQKKFTPEEVQAIKNEPGSYREKAKKYGVSTATIYKIMKDKY